MATAIQNHPLPNHPTQQVPTKDLNEVASNALRNKLLSRRDLANIFGVSKRTVSRLEEQRIGPPSIRIGRKVFYRWASVERWLQERETVQPIKLAQPCKHRDSAGQYAKQRRERKNASWKK